MFNYKDVIETLGFSLDDSEVNVIEDNLLTVTVFCVRIIVFFFKWNL